MPKKRTTPESSIDHKAIEGPHSFKQDDCSAKRAKLKIGVTTLQDLPCELFECIIIKAIVMEVKSMKLAKSVWKEKADLLIDRLRNVCSQWNQILSTNFFRKELHGTLDRTAQQTIRLEILHRSTLRNDAFLTSAMKDEIFLFCSQWNLESFINVYDRNNTAVVKTVIRLNRLSVQSMAACSASNCLYLLNSLEKCDHYSVSRISRDDGNRFVVSEFLGDMYLPLADLCVAANGRLIISRQQTKLIGAIAIYDANGTLQRRLRLPLDAPLNYQIIPKCNGNLVLVQHKIIPAPGRDETKVTEIALNGSIIRQYKSYSLDTFPYATNADSNGRILMCDPAGRMELLDSEFNLLEFSPPQLAEYNDLRFPHEMCYNRESSEIVAFADGQNSMAVVVLLLTEI